MLIDTHCHLDFPEFDQDRDRVIQHAKEQGIGYIINIGSSLEGSRKSLELAKQYDFIYATVGLHPHEADSFNKEIEVELTDLGKKDKVVAMGEIGLDYFKNYSQPDNQKTLFATLLTLAKNLGLPAVIHNRQAQDDTLKILKETKPSKAVVHCFSGDEHFLKECLEMGFLVSFTCNITYKKAEVLRSLLRAVPMDRLMLETDAPFLSPEGLRGKRCEPAYVKFVAEEIARIKNLDVEEVARITSYNAKNFFNLK